MSKTIRSLGGLAAATLLPFLLIQAGCDGGTTPPVTKAAKILSFTTNKASVASGEKVTLSWSTENATSIKIVATPGGNVIEGSTMASGSVDSMAITAPTTFVLTATGEGGSRLLLDDPHGAQDAQSDAMRGAAIEWFDQVWSTRMNDPKRDAMVTIMQRLHEDDVSGRILALGGWEHVCLPAEYEVPKKRSTTIIFKEGYDPRQQPGSLLWPERFGEQELKNLKAQLGEYGTAGQLQQRPAPAGGGILKTKHFQLWPKDRELPVFDYIVQSYDGAYDDNSMSDNDPTACTVWGCFTWKGEAGAMLLDAWDEHLGYPAFRKKVLEDWKSPYGRREGRKGRRADVVLMENKSAGISILQDLRDANIPAIPYNPGKNSKIMRAHAVAPVHELDCVYVLESSAEPGEFVQWARPFIEQVGKFPNATHDDYVDTYTQALHLLRDQGRFEQLPIHEEPPPEELPYRKKKGNPYAS